MAPEKAPAFQWYPKEYLSSAKVARMTLEQEGAYRRLLDYCWLDGSLPDDLAVLAGMCRVSAQKMRGIWECVSPCFRLDTADARGPVWRHDRLDTERTKQAESKERRRKAADERWERARAMQKQSECNAPAMQCSPSPIPSPTAVITQEAQIDAGAGADGCGPGEVWNSWRAEVEAEASDVLRMTPKATEYAHCQEVAAKGRPRPWVELVMRAYLRSKHRPIAEKPRTLGYLLHWWSWLENDLASKGYSPEQVAAA